MPRRSPRLRILPVLTALAAGCGGGQEDPDSSASGEAAASVEEPRLAPKDVFRMDSVAEGVWAAVVLARPEAYAFANSLVVAGDSALLVVDTQQSPAAARALLAWIQATFDLPVRWVVNTHYHGDHVNGNSAYRHTWPEVRFVAHASVPEAIRTDGRARIEEELSTLPDALDRRQAWLDGDTLPEGGEMTPDLRDRLTYSVRVGRAYLEELRELEVVVPDILLDASRTFDLGGRTVEVIPVGPAHTPGDLVVWIPDVSVVGVGDLLEEAAPWIDGADLRGWARALTRVGSLEPGWVMISHGSASRGADLLEGQTPLFVDLVAAAEREARAASAGDADWPTEGVVARVVEAIASHRAFLATVGVNEDGFADWANRAARQALAETAGQPAP